MSWENLAQENAFVNGERNMKKGLTREGQPYEKG